MRYFSYVEYAPTCLLSDESGGYVETLSEDEIREQYWPYWYGRMCEKFGKDHVNKNYCFEDCLEDWVIVNWAWEVNNEN